MRSALPHLLFGYRQKSHSLLTGSTFQDSQSSAEAPGESPTPSPLFGKARPVWLGGHPGVLLPAGMKQWLRLGSWNIQAGRDLTRSKLDLPAQSRVTQPQNVSLRERLVLLKCRICPQWMSEGSWCHSQYLKEYFFERVFCLDGSDHSEWNHQTD